MGKRGKVLLNDVRSTDGIRAEMELESKKGENKWLTHPIGAVHSPPNEHQIIDAGIVTSYVYKIKGIVDLFL